MRARCWARVRVARLITVVSPFAVEDVLSPLHLNTGSTSWMDTARMPGVHRFWRATGAMAASGGGRRLDLQRAFEQTLHVPALRQRKGDDTRSDRHDIHRRDARPGPFAKPTERRGEHHRQRPHGLVIGER